MTGDGSTRRSWTILEELRVVLDVSENFRGFESVGLQHLWMMDGSILPQIIDMRGMVAVEDGPEVGLVILEGVVERQVEEGSFDFDNLCLWEKEKGRERAISPMK